MARQSILDEINGCVFTAVGGFPDLLDKAGLLATVFHPLPSSSSPSGQRLAFQRWPRAPNGGGGGGISYRLSPTCEPPSWKDVQVVGFETSTSASTSSEYVAGFIQLYTDARHVFQNQPTRLFLHGFYIFGSKMERWVFDRSGLYSSTRLDLKQDHPNITTVLCSYINMSDAELGINPQILHDDQGNYISIKADQASGFRKFYLEDEPFVFPERIITEAPTCFRARSPHSTDYEFVVKIAWRSDDRGFEEKILRLIKERNAWGTVQLLGHTKVETILNLRRGLQFPTPQPRPHGEQSHEPSLGLESVIKTNDKPFTDLTLSINIVSPLGRPLGEFDNILEFLEAYRDAIKGHRSLLLDGKILHQDISKNNIIISDSKKEGEPRGVLIDFDLAMDLAVGPQRPGELVGTKIFMAIDLLAGKPHTYRHDLESFLYILLQTAICGSTMKLPSGSRLQRWVVGRWGDLSRKKTEDMSTANFTEILSEFTPQFKGMKKLAWALREVLFIPTKDGGLFTGTKQQPSEVGNLYNGMIGAVDEAISSYKK
ncbi:hypothetical protein FDECE_12272 [Fusarium decemcellulare]|nr:hypothetical protein FDECE_12272 [Fusarium decemcellulare]